MKNTKKLKGPGLNLRINEDTPIPVNVVLSIVGQITIYPGENFHAAYLGSPYDSKISYLDLLHYTNLTKPTIEELTKMLADGEAKSITGETVEIDGTDSKGFPSWLLAMNYI